MRHRALAGPHHHGGRSYGGFRGGWYGGPNYYEPPVQVFVVDDEGDAEKIRKAKALLKAKGVKSLAGFELPSTPVLAAVGAAAVWFFFVRKK